ncbi:MAG: TonB-dependent receptor [Sphingobium sp.]
MEDIKRQLFLSSAVLVGSLCIATVANAATTEIEFRIPSQPVQSAVILFTQQSGVQVLYPFERVMGLKTRAISGRMSPQIALQRMLAGTGLKVANGGGDVMTLISEAQPMPVRVEQPIRLVSFSPPTASLAVTVAGQAMPAVSAGAVSETPQAMDAESEPIVVTGTRGRPRTITESATPIDVIPSVDLERTGRPGVLAALNTLVPSFNMPTRAGGGTSTVITTGGLRGLNPDQALILVNGKRRHKSSLINAVSSFYNGSVPADLDLIPTSAVERIEVLRDGAAAQYGSDAIAGVINIILKDGKAGGAASFTAGQNYDRSDGENYLAQANYGMALGSGGFLDLFANGKIQKRSNRAVPIDSSINLYPLVNGQRDPREASIDRLVTKNYGAFPVDGVNLGYNLLYSLSPDISVYTFGTYSRRKSELNFTFRAPNNSASLPQIYPNGFRPYLNIIEDDFEFALGLKGILGGWN